MTSAALCDSAARRTPVPPCAPRDNVRIATVSPAARCASRVPAAPISTSSGWAPTASTVSWELARTARPCSTSLVTFDLNSSGVIGFWMNSTADWRRADTAMSTVAWAVATAIGRLGSSCLMWSISSSPEIDGMSTSVITKSHGPSATWRNACNGSSS